MDISLTQVEQKLVDHAKESVVKYNNSRHAKGGIDTLYGFLITEEGTFYDGASFEPNIVHATVCGERHAIANLVMNESYGTKIKSIVIADPVPRVQEKSRPPCGTCRNLIWEFGSPDTSVILIQYIQQQKDNGELSWTFPKLEKYSINDFYPYPFEQDPDLWK